MSAWACRPPIRTGVVAGADLEASEQADRERCASPHRSPP